MSGREKALQEIVRGLEGLMTLNEWEQTLLKDLQTKAENALRVGRGPEPPAREKPEQTS